LGKIAHALIKIVFGFKFCRFIGMVRDCVWHYFDRLPDLGEPGVLDLVHFVLDFLQPKH
jgi:hypothetical protein